MATKAQARLKSSGDDKAVLDQELESSKRPGRRTAPRAYPQRNATATNGRPTQEQQLANGMGWFGVGLGLAELLAPRRVAAMIGVNPRYQILIRMMGLRELASSAGILRDRSSPAAVWTRVAGESST